MVLSASLLGLGVATPSFGQDEGPLPTVRGRRPFSRTLTRKKRFSRLKVLGNLRPPRALEGYPVALESLAQRLYADVPGGHLIQRTFWIHRYRFRHALGHEPGAEREDALAPKLSMAGTYRDLAWQLNQVLDAFQSRAETRLEKKGLTADERKVARAALTSVKRFRGYTVDRLPAAVLNFLGHDLEDLAYAVSASDDEAERLRGSTSHRVLKRQAHAVHELCALLLRDLRTWKRPGRRGGYRTYRAYNGDRERARVKTMLARLAPRTGRPDQAAPAER